jgi:glycerol-3-phosphate acyltransferase PlsY
MSPAATLAVAATAAYLVGSIPFGLLIAQFGHGVDVRKHGSGNIGATNVGRVLGKKWGIVCLVLDALKGLLPTLLPRVLSLPESWVSLATVTCGAAAIAGHVFPVWLGFRGGKGVATGAGVAAVVCWQAAFAALAAFAAVLIARKFVSLASIAAAGVYAAATLAVLGKSLHEEWPTAVFSIAIPALIVARHRDNIRRLLRGEEVALTTAEMSSTTEQPVAKSPMS